MADRVGQQLGNYHLLRLLGRGAFAEVYLGEHEYLERPAAIKLLHVQMEPDTQEQFRREARTIAHLQHPHIVQVHDFGLHDQTPYLVMEYTPGGTLRSHHPKGTQLSLEQIVTYVKQIASALDYAHEQRVIHRDIKPANLLLNAKGEVVLTDFGLAVVQQTLESLSPHGPAGTPLYMAPEQIRHHPCPASDQYALGIMVYQWLCGEPPFSGQLYALLGQHLAEPPPSLCERLPDLPRAVEEAVFRALAKEPGERFATVQDFALALEEACFGTQPLMWWGSANLRSSDQNAPPAPALLASLHTGNGQPLLAARPAPSPQSISTAGKPTLAQSNRQRFLRRVRAFWIEGVLEHSLHGAALIALGLQDQRDALANPWHLVVHHPDTAPRPFPVGTSITQVYDAANGELLILGAPGAGKTTLLLELARDLLNRAEQDEQQQMPVVFTLSSWATKQQPLGEWMIEELISKYQVPRQLAHLWVETDQILPLLDGLDEVEAASRTKCIETINAYQQEHAFLPLVVSSRSADYLAQSARVKLTNAVTIQPLTQQQVDDYLAQAGEPLWALRVALHQDATLRELAETPLMLSILTLTYHGMPVEELLRGGIAPTRQQVFERYVERMVERKGSVWRYPLERTQAWLGWLAGQMRAHSQTVFYLEHLQPTWFPKKRTQIIHKVLSGLAVGLLVGLAMGLLGGWDIGLAVGLLGGLFGGLDTAEIQPSEKLTWSWNSFLRWLLDVEQVLGLLSGLFVGGLLGGLFLGLVGGLSNTQVDEHARLRPNQGIQTSGWNALRSGLLIWLLFGALGGLAIGLVGRLAALLLFGALGGLVIGPSGALVVGLRAALLVGLLVGLLFGGVAYLQHYCLRFLLWRYGATPWRYVRFLEEATRRILLQRVGGGYRFIHPLFQEYFASLGPAAPPPSAQQPPSHHP